MKVAVFSTSLRKGSFSMRVSKFLMRLFEQKESLELSLFNFEEADIPLVGRGDLDPDQLTPFQRTLVDQWKEADLVLFVVPEYNWFTGGELFNTFHQVGNQKFRYLFHNKTFAFAGVSSGRGGRLPGIEMTTMVNKITAALGGQSVVCPLLFESQYTADNLDEEGNSLGNAVYDKAAREFVSYSLTIASRWKKGGI